MNPATQDDLASDKEKDRDDGANGGDRAELAYPRIAPCPDRLARELPRRGEGVETTPNPANLLGGHVHDLRQLAAIAHTVASAESEEKAEVVNLQQVSQIRRIAASQQLLQVLKENF